MTVIFTQFFLISLDYRLQGLLIILFMCLHANMFHHWVQKREPDILDIEIQAVCELSYVCSRNWAGFLTRAPGALNCRACLSSPWSREFKKGDVTLPSFCHASFLFLLSISISLWFPLPSFHLIHVSFYSPPSPLRAIISIRGRKHWHWSVLNVNLQNSALKNHFTCKYPASGALLQ